MAEVVSVDASSIRKLPILGVRYNVIRRDCPIRQHQPTKGSKCPKCKGTGGGLVEGRLGGVVGSCPRCGGAGRIGAKPGETTEAFYQRLADDYFKKAPDEWFMRWRSEVGPHDVARFKRECLDPVLENLLDDYEWWEWCSRITGPEAVSPFHMDVRKKRFPGHCPRHFRVPFGIYNVLAEGGSSDLDEFLNSGSEVGLERAETLFRELE